MLDENGIIELVGAAGTLDNRFSALKPIDARGGGGHFSVVFRGMDSHTNRQVAVKFFLDRGDPYRALCFQREATLLSTTLKDDHRFVQSIGGLRALSIPLIASGVAFQVTLPFIVLQWMPGGSLEAACIDAPTNVAAVQRRLRLFSKACHCVHAFHRLEGAHRDLKPGNFMRGSDEELRLADFGTARLFSAQPLGLRPSYGSPVGDFRYAAPEQIAALETQPTAPSAKLADMYALGAMLFELLTGHSFWSQNTAVFQVARQIGGIPQSARNRAYLQSTISGHLPSVQRFCGAIPSSSRFQLDTLVRSLTEMDYSIRLSDFPRIYRLLQKLQLTLKKELRSGPVVLGSSKEDGSLNAGS